MLCTPKRVPPTGFKRNQIPLSRARFCSLLLARPNRVGLVLFPSPLRRGPPSLSSRWLRRTPAQPVGPQWAVPGGPWPSPGLTRDPQAGGGVESVLPPSPSPPDVTQPRGRCSAPQPGAESVRRPGGLKPNQTAPHPRHYLTGELGGQ